MTVRIRYGRMEHGNDPFKTWLTEYGDDLAAEALGARPNTVKSWRLRYRYPRPEHARRIVQIAPVTMADIYGTPLVTAPIVVNKSSPVKGRDPPGRD